MTARGGKAIAYLGARRGELERCAAEICGKWVSDVTESFCVPRSRRGEYSAWSRLIASRPLYPRFRQTADSRRATLPSTSRNGIVRSTQFRRKPVSLVCVLPSFTEHLKNAPVGEADLEGR